MAPHHRSQKISAVIVTRNDATRLERALQSLSWVDEIIVVYQGSTDATLEIARKYTEQVFYHPSANRSVLKNYGFKLAGGDWILLLEAHEWVEEMLRHEIDGIMLSSQNQAYLIPRKLHFQGTWLQHGRLYPKAQLRLFRRNAARAADHVFFQQLLTHSEDIKIGRLERAIGAEPYSSIEALFTHVHEAATRSAFAWLEREGWNPKQSGGFATSLTNLTLRPLYTFLYRYVVMGGFKDGFGGLTLALANGYHTFIKYAQCRSILTNNINSSHA